MSQYTLRPFVPDDLSLVYDSWLNSWRSNPWAGTVPNNRFYDCQRDLIDGLLARGAMVLVADAGRTLMGFACGEVKDGTTVLHYLHVKDAFHAYRGQIAADLVVALPGAKPGFITHRTRETAPLLSGPGRWRHVPEMARRKDL